TTTLVAFSPLLFWPGIMGEFMSYLPLTLIVTLSSSLFVAMVINPALASIFIKVKDGASRHRSTEEVVQAGESPVEIKGVLLTAYDKLLRVSLRHRVVVLAAAGLLLVFFILLWLLLVGIEKPVELFPEIDPPSMYVNVDMPEGANIEYSDAILKQIETLVFGAAQEEVFSPKGTLDEIYYGAAVMKEHRMATGQDFKGPSNIPNVEHVYSKAVASEAATSAFEDRAANHVGVQFLDFNERVESSRKTLAEIRRRVKDVPGAKITVKSADEGPPTGAPINIEISGDDYRVLGKMAREIRGELEKMPHVEDIRDDFVEGSPSVRVKIDRQRAALFGLSTGNIGYALKAGYNGLVVSTYREGGDDYDITVQLSDPDRRVTDILRELLLPTPAGKLVPLTSIATIGFAGNIGTIMHIDSERVVTVKANVEDVPGPVARQAAEKELEKLQLPPGYKVKFTGEFEFQKESEEFLSQAFLIALLMIFLVLVTQFNSVSQPFIIMSAVLLSLGGAFLGLTTIDSPFGIIMTGVGVISLAGVVVNNGIVLIDYINKLRERGMDVVEAVIAGGATRLRPVLLTAITTILGLLPMVTGVSYDFHEMAMSWSSESSQWWRSMAIVVIYGLMVATFLTLVVVPSFYSLLYDMGQETGAFFRRLGKLYWRPYEIITGKRGEYQDD
ncbi:MAG: efflux RND transporter permease subunit, partial [Thermodesulfobacteriota bacterium]